jgi:hydroxyacylglutathione hydrolase
MMKMIEKITSEGIAQNSYFIASGDVAAVIEPHRDCDAYVEFASSREVKIQYVFETHRNEDYLIGSLELAALHTPGHTYEMVLGSMKAWKARGYPVER